MPRSVLPVSSGLAHPSLLAELRHHAGHSQLRLVNYAAAPQSIHLEFPTPVAGTLLSPDAGSPPLVRRLATLAST